MRSRKSREVCDERQTVTGSAAAFLRGLNMAVGGLALGYYFPTQAQKPAKEPGKAPGLNPNAFIHLAPDGIVTIVCQRSEMGQGIRSSLPVLIAMNLARTWPG